MVMTVVQYQLLHVPHFHLSQIWDFDDLTVAALAPPITESLAASLLTFTRLSILC